MCGTRLAENARPKKVAKNRHLGTIAQVVGDSQTLRVEWRAPPMIGRAAIMLGIGLANILVYGCNHKSL